MDEQITDAYAEKWDKELKLLKDMEKREFNITVRKRVYPVPPEVEAIEEWALRPAINKQRNLVAATEAVLCNAVEERLGKKLTEAFTSIIRHHAFKEVL